ncbi:hypothetical protein [Flavobacterium sp.]|uniref:hypothetical protein n=1 Tax=Flavobacterium sp. TaxID=239 RepID=UPI0028BDC167|nr:hypothetical protein [Flavobacterium sp.]
MSININGKIKVKTDKKGNIFGAKKGSTYATIVNTAKTMLKKNAVLLNHDNFFTYSCVA